jgi:gas vesicle protein
MSMKQAAGFLLTGAMVGAAVTLLYAPQSGVRTTKDIRNFARKTVNRLDDLQEDLRDQLADWTNDMTEVVNDGIARGKKLGAEGYEQVLQGFDNAKKCVDEGKSRFEQLIRPAKLQSTVYRRGHTVRGSKDIHEIRAALSHRHQDIA